MLSWKFRVGDAVTHIEYEELPKCQQQLYFMWSNTDKLLQAQLSKFAELIVSECIQAIQNESMDSDDEWEYGLRLAEGAIREHFGISSW